MVDPAGERRAVTNGDGRTKRLRRCAGGRSDGNRKRDAALTQAATRGGAQTWVVAVRASIGAAKRVHSEHNRHHHQNDGSSHMSHGRLILADDLRLGTWTIFLNRRTPLVPEGTVHAAITRLGPQQRVAASAFVEEHATVERHGFSLRTTAVRTSERDVYVYDHALFDLRDSGLVTSVSSNRRHFPVTAGPKSPVTSPARSCR